MPEADISIVDLDLMTKTELMELIKAALDRLTPVRFNEVIEAVGERRRAKEAEVKETFFCRNARACNADGALV